MSNDGGAKCLSNQKPRADPAGASLMKAGRWCAGWPPKPALLGSTPRRSADRSSAMRPCNCIWIPKPLDYGITWELAMVDPDCAAHDKAAA